jgi:hypothetical protein
MPVWGKPERNAPVIPNLPTAGSTVIGDLIPLIPRLLACQWPPPQAPSPGPFVIGHEWRAREHFPALLGLRHVSSARISWMRTREANLNRRCLYTI